MKTVVNEEFLLLLPLVMIITETELQNQKYYSCDFNFVDCAFLAG
jgi:hypothetical protein